MRPLGCDECADDTTRLAFGDSSATVIPANCWLADDPPTSTLLTLGLPLAGTADLFLRLDMNGGIA